MGARGRSATMPAADEDFVTFVREASPRLLRAAWFICGDAHQAEDLVQQSLVKVYQRWGRLRDGNPTAYARRCLLTQHIDDRRRSHETVVATMPETATTDTDPEDTRSLVRLLGQLPLRERQVVVLRHYVGLSEAETAESLGVSVGTVKSSASRGLARLRDILTALDREEQTHAH